MTRESEAVEGYERLEATCRVRIEAAADPAVVMCSVKDLRVGDTVRSFVGWEKQHDGAVVAHDEVEGEFLVRWADGGEVWYSYKNDIFRRGHKWMKRVDR